jgi:hypothetical protein
MNKKQNVRLNKISYLTVLLTVPFIALSFHSNFGMIDDHLYLQVGDPVKYPNISQIFHNYFSLQPYGRTKRFQPTQLILWSLQSWLFKLNSKESAVLWYLVPTLLMLISAILLVKLVKALNQLISIETNLSWFSRVTLEIAFCITFLALPVWKTSGFKLGIPEIYELPLILLCLLLAVRIYIEPWVLRNFAFLTFTCIALTGVRETAFWYGLIPSITFIFYRSRLDRKQNLIRLALSVTSILVTIWIIGGYYYQVLHSGSDVYGAPIGIARMLSAYRGAGSKDADIYLSLLVLAIILGAGILSFSKLINAKRILICLLGLNVAVFLIDSFMLGPFFIGQYSTQRYLYLFILFAFEVLMIIGSVGQNNHLIFGTKNSAVIFALILSFAFLPQYLGNFEHAKFLNAQNSQFNFAIRSAVSQSNQSAIPLEIVSSNPWDYEPIYSTAFNLRRFSNQNIFLVYKASPEQLTRTLPDFATRANLDSQLKSIEESGDMSWNISARKLNVSNFICLRMPNTEKFYVLKGCVKIIDTN